MFDSVFNAMITQSLRRFNLCTIKKPDKSREFLQKQRSEAYFHIRERIENLLREYPSAHTPEKNEIKNCGRYAAIVIADNHIPDDVCMVTYHINAN